MALRLFAKTAFNTNSKSLTSLRAITAASFHTTSVTCQAAPVEWKIDSVRTGVIARKKGMTALWTESGVRIPVTVLQLEDNVVTDIRTEEKHGYTALQVGCTVKKEKHTTKPLLEHFKKLGVGLRQKLFEFRVTKDALLPIGTELTASHFVEGQFVDVTAPSIGKGFAGVMKRWNFKGLPASHGVSLTHRSAGSTGQRKWPSKVFKGKKMAGRLGGENVTVQNLKVVKVDPALNLVFVKGAVPGFDDQFVKIKDAVKLRGEKLFPKEAIPPPFPTAIKQ
ncbi:translation protein [Rhizopus microsporus var. microsporus]|uniref:Large ribosomal subunit protein uL3m n=2 Tax=Rhizopus microsporus TaxID=58291 RepID=A0A2G4SJJ4_RHIZD|nr:translation protein [Rhizopus microsporus ATCC 52813]ORE11277.1 translation protein [Rhizopus microsporus var. microsporus]PHZ08947.1 translation protein [Rhizopus microsporus ATCC 52813]